MYSLDARLLLNPSDGAHLKILSTIRRATKNNFQPVLLRSTRGELPRGFFRHP